LNQLVVFLLIARSVQAKRTAVQSRVVGFIELFIATAGMPDGRHRGVIVARKGGGQVCAAPLMIGE